MRKVIKATEEDIHHSGREALRRIRALSLRESSCLHFRFEQGNAPDLHSHAHGQIIFAPSELVTVTVEGHVWCASAANGIWIPPDVPHQVNAKRDRSTYNLYLAPRVAQTLPATAAALEISSLLRELLLRLSKDKEAATEEGWPQFLKAAIAEAGQLLRHSQHIMQSIALSTENSLLDTIANTLAHDPADPRSLDDWAVEFGISRRTLSRIVHATIGMNWRTWRSQLRMTAAVRLLQLGVPIKAVAYDLGYAGPTPFIAAFTRNFGITPGQATRSYKMHR